MPKNVLFKEIFTIEGGGGGGGGNLIPLAFSSLNSPTPTVPCTIKMLLFGMVVSKMKPEFKDLDFIPQFFCIVRL